MTMMLSDEQLLEELEKRLENNKKALWEQEQLMKELALVNNKLEEAESLKSAFLSNIKNEINNPFASILALASKVIETEYNKPLRVRDIARLIFKEAFDLDMKLKNIFSAADIESGDITIEFIKVDIPSTTANLVDYFRHLYGKKSLTVSIQNNLPTDADGQFFFITDPEKLKAVLQNLLQNAIEYSNPNGEITVQLSLSEEQSLEIAVKDQGMGIEEEKRAEIFDRFTQLETGLTKNHHGLGLGLCVAKAALDILDGTIRFESEKGMGTIFTIRLPQHKDGPLQDDMALLGDVFLMDSTEKY